MGVVKFYGGGSCPQCKMAKQYLEENNVELDYVDVHEDYATVEHIVSITGSMIIPQIFFPDDSYVVGYKKKLLEEKLAAM